MKGTPYVSSVSEASPNEKQQLELSKDPEHSTLPMKNHNTQIEIPSLTDKERVITCGISHQDSFNETSTSTNYDNISKVVSHPSRTLYYPSLDKCVTLEADLQVL